MSIDGTEVVSKMWDCFKETVDSVQYDVIFKQINQPIKWPIKSLKEQSPNSKGFRKAGNWCHGIGTGQGNMKPRGF